MTQDRIAFFENLLKKPMAEPHRGYIEELLQAVKGKFKPDFKGAFYTPEGEHKPKAKSAPHKTQPATIDTLENTDA